MADGPNEWVVEMALIPVELGKLNQSLKNRFGLLLPCIDHRLHSIYSIKVLYLVYPP
jgi:hypothetical protein